VGGVGAAVGVVWCGVVWAWACGREIRLVRSAEMGEVEKVRSDENREHTDTRVLSKREEAVIFWEYGFREGNGSDLRQERERCKRRWKCVNRV
jgi:hypothetical protein